MNVLVYCAMIMLPALINVAFFTLLERKVLGLSQSRRGPNKVYLLGVLQPIADAVKLFCKQLITPIASLKLMFVSAPIGALTTALMLWAAMPVNNQSNSFTFSGVLMILVLSMGLYPLFLEGWASMSAYALIGSMRGVAQTISYEISMAIFLLSFLVLNETANLSTLKDWESKEMIFFLWAPMGLLWMICCVAETNRTPFDFSEGESELVSGFNVEYSGGGFTLIFMAEYASILALSALTSVLLLNTPMGSLLTALLILTIAITWVWLRATLPRFRYDKLMYLAWTSLLPLSLGSLMTTTMV